MSLERAWANSPTNPMSFLQSDSAVGADFQKELTMSPENFKSALEYFYGPEEDIEEQSMRYATVFQAKTPGAMSLEDVENQIDLGQWKLKLGDRFVVLEVKAID